MRILILISFFATVTSYSQKEIKLPDIKGDPQVNSAPEGWEIFSHSPDIIDGNGLWPGYGVESFIDGIDGEIPKKDGMSLLIASRINDNCEGLKTSLTGLRIGETYRFDIMWQQVEHLLNDKISYGGGGLMISVDGVQRQYTYPSFDDAWHQASFEFTATNNVAEVIIRAFIPEKYGSSGYVGAAIVVDTFKCEKCKEAGS